MKAIFFFKLSAQLSYSDNNSCLKIKAIYFKALLK
jgi:hypothetical protein